MSMKICGARHIIACTHMRQYLECSVTGGFKRICAQAPEHQMTVPLSNCFFLQDTEGPVEVEVTPVYVALVDTTGGEEYMELVKSALLAALEALPSCALFGLATYTDQVCLLNSLLNGLA